MTTGRWRRFRRRAGLAVAVMTAAAVPLADPAGSQTPAEVRDGAAPTGVWVADPAVDRQALEADVARARDAGVDLVVVVAPDPQPDAEGFALRVRQLGVGDPVLVVAPDGTVGVSTARIDRTALNRARDSAEGHDTPEAATEAFTDALLREPEEGVPDLVDDVVNVVILAVLVLGTVVVVEQALRYHRRSRRRRRATAG